MQNRAERIDFVVNSEIRLVLQISEPSSEIHLFTESPIYYKDKEKKFYLVKIRFVRI